MRKNKIILLHAIFWITTITSTLLTNIPELGKHPIGEIIKGYSIYLVSFVTLFYLFYSFISIKYLNRKSLVLLFIFGLLFTIIVTIPIAYFYIYVMIDRVFTLTGKSFLLAFASYYSRILETNVMFVTAGSLMKIVLLWYKNITEQKEIEKQLIANELALLRAQINPNFLFNILNTLSSLIYAAPSKAIYSVEKLSEIMSYMLYESSEENVFLENEINYVKNYLDLQKVRYDDPGLVDFRVTGDYRKLKIPPLIFIPLIENVFKYGEDVPGAPGMKINLDVRDRDLSFEVKNYFKGSGDREIKDGDFSLDSIRRRFDLLFKDRYRLGIKNENNEHTVRLDLSFAV
jgi:two-component system LytT family sensor kinase